MSETAGEKADRLIGLVVKGVTRTVYGRGAAKAAIRAAFKQAERADLLERALLALSGVTATLAYRAELTAEDCEELGISRRDACSYRGWCRWAQRQPDLAEAEREAKEGDDNAS